MAKRKGKKSNQVTSILGILLSIIAIIIGICSQEGMFFGEEQIAQVNANTIGEAVVSEEINLQDENLHIIYFDVGQADCILVQNKRNNNAN